MSKGATMERASVYIPICNNVDCEGIVRSHDVNQLSILQTSLVLEDVRHPHSI